MGRLKGREVVPGYSKLSQSDRERVDRAFAAGKARSHAMRHRAVLRLVNRGRRAIGLARLRRLPKGRIEDPRRCPLGRALGVSVGELERPCVYCACVETHLHTGDRRKAHALSRVFGTGLERNPGSGFSVTAPKELARFNRGVNLGEWPELIEASRAD
jgi:hypothetical protein